jgi:uncharacterized protein
MAKKTTLPKKIRKNIKDYITVLKADKIPIQKVFVFGSQAKGTTHKWSDIDVCVVSPRFKNSFDALNYLLKKSYEIDAPIEPHPYHPKDFVNEDPLVWEIKKTGIPFAIT